ncbi:hypothetical protein [Nostoc sp. C110]|uniref:hypothetical protein n=1 Tax=Nostoc sp. C110 TaxID=3349876 RepID=UPI00370D01FF
MVRSYAYSLSAKRSHILRVSIISIFSEYFILLIRKSNTQSDRTTVLIRAIASL